LHHPIQFWAFQSYLEAVHHLLPSLVSSVSRLNQEKICALGVLESIVLCKPHLFSCNWQNFLIFCSAQPLPPAMSESYLIDSSVICVIKPWFRCIGSLEYRSRPNKSTSSWTTLLQLSHTFFETLSSATETFDSCPWQSNSFET
jgi:hypothetical protein